MYTQFYNFTEKPFNTTPDTKFFFPSAKHTEALNSLIYAINERKGFVVITGEIGAGKTTVCRAMLNKLEPNTKVALITNTNFTCKELLEQMLEEFEVEYKPGSKQKLLMQLNQYLIQQLAQDMNMVLIIDEAQNLSSKVLEEVRMLSNLETEKEKLIQIILLGQPQLKVKLQNPKLEQFKQRIAVYYHIPGLTRQETEEYIIYRLKLVSSNGVAGIFTSGAIDLLFTHSGGIPRIINLVCDSALLSGYIGENKSIDTNIIQEVVRENHFYYEENSIAQERCAKKENEDKKINGAGIKIYCCADCQHYMTCQKKWLRGANGQEQLCCSACKKYQACISSVLRNTQYTRRNTNMET